jgi:hypothetical protein
MPCRAEIKISAMRPAGNRGPKHRHGQIVFIGKSDKIVNIPPTSEAVFMLAAIS